MDLQSPCNIFCTTSYRRNPSLFRRRNSFNFATKCRRGTTSSELQVSPESPPRISLTSSAPTHKVTVHDRQRDVVHEFYVPEDQYILHTAEAQNISLPFACRHGIGSIIHVAPTFSLASGLITYVALGRVRDWGMGTIRERETTKLKYLRYRYIMGTAK